MNIERISINPIGDRAAWLELRRRDITASDVPSVCGEGLFGSPAKVWAEKRGLLSEAEMTEPMKRGLWGEAAVFEALAWEHPDWEIRRAKVYLRDRDIGLGATPDGAAILPGREGVYIVQTKVIARSVFEANWIEPGADIDDPTTVVTAPLAYQLQTLTEMMLGEAQGGVIAALVVDEWKWRLRLMFLGRHEVAEASIRERVANFRKNYIDTGIQPPIDPERDDNLVKQLWPVDNGKEIILASDNELPVLIDDLVAAKTAKKQAEEAEKIAATAIKAKIGDYAIAVCADGRRISYNTIDRAGYFVQPTSYRVLRVLKGRAS